MSDKNLQEFWAVQECSDGRYHIFVTEDEAFSQCRAWDEELDRLLDVFDRTGVKSPNLMLESKLVEGDNGKWTNEVIVHPASRPSGVKYYAPFTATADVWLDSPGFDSIRWGNPATARPIREDKHESSSKPRPILRRLV